MHFSDPTNTATSRPSRVPGHWLRRLAAPAAGLLIISFGLGLTPGVASAATSGTLSVAPASAKFATLASSRTSSRTVVTLKVPASLTFAAAIQLRAANTSTGYRSKIVVADDGAVSVSLGRVIGGKETDLGAARITGVSVKPGETILLQGAIAGFNPVRVFVRAWKKGSATPDWQLAAQDYTASRITKAGRTRLWGYLPGTATATKIAFSKVSTSSTSVAKVKAYRVLTWAPNSQPVTETPAEPPTTTSGKPSADNTGVKPGSTLTRHDGDITVTTDGTVLRNLDIHGFVTVKAKNVTISNCIVRGGKSKGYATGLITNYGNPGLVISDTDVVAEFPSVYFDGIKGSEFTATRVHVVGNVDSVKIHGGNNVTIQDSLLENTVYYASDPQQNGGSTHNDNIQILDGSNLKITGNTIRGATGFAVLGSAEHGNVNLTVTNNWLDGGHCTVKLATRDGHSETATVTNNKFGPNRAVSSCVFTSYPVVNLTQSANTYETTGATVKPLILVS